MRKHIKATTALTLGRQVAEIWKANPSYRMEEVKLEDYVTFLEATNALDKTFAQREVELAGIKAIRRDQIYKLYSLVTRFRSGMYSHFGPDSLQYGQAGGTRSSDRKPRSRKAGTGQTPSASS